MDPKKEIELLKAVIHEKNRLLSAYRIGNQDIADKALTKLDYLYEKLGYKPN